MNTSSSTQTSSKYNPSNFASDVRQLATIIDGIIRNQGGQGEALAHQTQPYSQLPSQLQQFSEWCKSNPNVIMQYFDNQSTQTSTATSAS